MDMEQKTQLQESCIAFAKQPLAAGVTWKDCTSYSRNAIDRIPTAFSTNVGVCRITITCGHLLYKPDWCFHCYELGFDTSFLGGNLTASEAAVKAIGICKNKVKELNDAFNDCE